MRVALTKYHIHCKKFELSRARNEDLIVVLQKNFDQQHINNFFSNTLTNNLDNTNRL